MYIDDIVNGVHRVHDDCSGEVSALDSMPHQTLIHCDMTAGDNYRMYIGLSTDNHIHGRGIPIHVPGPPPTQGPKQVTRTPSTISTTFSAFGLHMPTTTPRPTRKPTLRPSRKPTEKPTPKPSYKPTDEPTGPPTESPTETPTHKPTPSPTPKPSLKPTDKPSEKPTSGPSEDPTQEPTLGPTSGPTEGPTDIPTNEPTLGPTSGPTEGPTHKPTNEPTLGPTSGPTEEPTKFPTEEPTVEPTMEPTEEPTLGPTSSPTEEPTPEPTISKASTVTPTSQPSKGPTQDLSLKATLQKPTLEIGDKVNLNGEPGCIIHVGDLITVMFEHAEMGTKLMKLAQRPDLLEEGGCLLDNLDQNIKDQKDARKTPPPPTESEGLKVTVKEKGQLDEEGDPSLLWILSDDNKLPEQPKPKGQTDEEGDHNLHFILSDEKSTEPSNGDDSKPELEERPPREHLEHIADHFADDVSHHVAKDGQTLNFHVQPKPLVPSSKYPATSKDKEELARILNDPSLRHIEGHEVSSEKSVQERRKKMRDKIRYAFNEQSAGDKAQPEFFDIANVVSQDPDLAQEVWEDFMVAKPREAGSALPETLLTGCLLILLFMCTLYYCCHKSHGDKFEHNIHLLLEEDLDQ